MYSLLIYVEKILPKNVSPDTSETDLLHSKTFCPKFEFFILNFQKNSNAFGKNSNKIVSGHLDSNFDSPDEKSFAQGLKILQFF